MAVAFDAVGPSAAGAGTTGASPLTWAHNPAAGAALVVGICLDHAFGTVAIGAVTFGGVAMTPLGSVNVAAGSDGGLFLFGLLNVTGGSQTVSVSWTGTSDAVCAGSVSFTAAGSFGTFQSATAGTGTQTKGFTTASAASLVAAFDATGGGAAVTTSAGTQRFTNNQGGGAGTCGNVAGSTAPGTGGTVTVTFAGNTAASFAVAGVEVLPAAIAPPSPISPQPVPPGWFPGADTVTAVPGGIPFAPLPGTTDATPGVIILPTPEAAAPPLPLLAPGWFPGSAAVTQDPGGIPFYAEPPPLTATPAVVFPVPEVAGEVPWLPWPPGYFPGSQAVAVDPGGIPFYSQPQPLTAPVPPPPPPTITTLAGSGAAGYFADQNGTPRMWVGDEIWALITNAGRWNSGNYRATFDAYFSARAAQGFTICYSDMFGSAFIGGVGNGQMWDGTTPFTGGNPSTGLNEAYWSRIDYALSAAAANGVTVALSFGGHWDWDVSGNSMFGLTGTQYTDAGNAIGSRYKGRPNLLWLIMDDYFSSFDSSLTSLLTGLRASGDTHPIAIENFSETSSRFDLSNNTVLAWGTSNSQYNFGYSYSCTYLCIEYMYAEASPLPCIYGDGYFYQGGAVYAGGSGAGALDRAARQDAWWAVTSGARGWDLGDEALWQWPSTAPAAVPTQWFAANNAGNIRALMESLPGWHTLTPATGSTLITAGRGTRGTQLASGGGGGQYEPAFTNSYVSASRTPDTGSGSVLAVMYLPTATTITVDQTKMVAGYLAYWADPVTGVKTSTTAGATYNSTAQGNNSRGDPDWVLILQGQAPAPVTPAAPGLPGWQPQPPGWFPGADQVTDLPGGIPFYVIPQPADQASPTVTVITPQSLAGSCVFAVTPNAGAGITPAALPGTAAFPASGIRADIILTAPSLAVPAAFTAPDVHISETVTPAVLAGTAAFPAPASNAGSGVTPVTLTAAAVFPAVQAAAGETVTPAVLAGSSAFPAPGIAAGAVIIPASLAGTGSFPAPGIRADTILSVTSLAAPAAFTAPSVTAGGNATVTPACLTGTSIFAGPVNAGETVTPVVLTAAAVSGAAVNAGSGITAPALNRTAAFTAPQPNAGEVTVPAAFAGLAAFTAPAVSAGAVITPVTLTAPAGWGAGVQAGDVTAPAAFAAAAAFPAVSVQAASSASIIPAPLTAPAAFPAPGITTGALAVVTLATFAAFPAPAVLTGFTGTVTWAAHPAPPRWQAKPALSRWGACPAQPRWRITVSQFAPIAALSLEEINVTWGSGLAGTSIDPTGQTAGQTALPVQMAFPVSSGNPALPAEPVTWYAAAWLLGGTSSGYVAQCLVGPGGGVVTLTAGMSYDVWSKISGTPEIPVKYAGTVSVY